MFAERIKRLKLRNADIQEQVEKITAQAKQLSIVVQRMQDEFNANKVRIDLFNELEKEKNDKTLIPKK